MYSPLGHHNIIWRKENIMKWSNTLKWILNKQDMRVLIVFIWLKMGSSYKLLWIRHWTFEAHKREGISRLADTLKVYETSLVPVKLHNWLKKSNVRGWDLNERWSPAVIVETKARKTFLEDWSWLRLVACHLSEDKLNRSYLLTINSSLSKPWQHIGN